MEKIKELVERIKKFYDPDPVAGMTGISKIIGAIRVVGTVLAVVIVILILVAIF